MNRVCINIDELVSGVSKVGLGALKHAAEISTQVTERTIGPDLPEFNVANKLDQNKDNETKNLSLNNKQDNNKKGHGDNLHTQEVISPRSPSSPSFQYLDYQTLNSSILIREAEQQRRKSIRKEVIQMQERRSVAKHNSAEKKGSHIKEEHDQWLAEKRRNEAYILVEAEKQALRLQQDREQELKAIRLQTQRQIQIISFQGISQYHNKFRNKYENVARLLMSIDKQELLACEEYNKRLKDLIPQFEKLIGKIKAGECGAAELVDAENLCKCLDALEDSIIKALENIVQQEEQRAMAAKNEEEAQEQERKHQEELLQQQQHQQQQQKVEETRISLGSLPAPQDNVAQDPANFSGVSSQPQTEKPITTNETQDALAVSATVAAEAKSLYVSSERFTFYTHINTFYQEKVEKMKPLQTDDNMKKYRFACQKAINIPVNAISAVSPQHLRDKFEKLYNFISGQPIKTAEGHMVSVNDHPLGRDYCILLMAKKFVSQGDTAVSSNPQAAFPIATVIVSLWKLVPDFGKIFLAYIFKESPFLVPYFIPQKRGQAVEDYYKILGYRLTNGHLEQQDMYLKRQAGIARLYAAVMITNGRQTDGPQHPYGIEEAWRWLTNFISLSPLPDICATLMMEILQTVGGDMWRAYGRQFAKLLIVIQQYFPKLSAVDEGGPKARLELALGNFLREGQIPGAQGLLPLGFW